MSSIKKDAANSVLWSAIERFSVQGIQYVITIILARLLLPSDYGLIAMLTVFLAIAQTFIDGGFGNALIHKNNRTAVDYSTVFYFNTAVSVILYCILYVCSPYIASFYGEPSLDIISKVTGLILIINSLGIVQQTKLTIALDFKRQAIASLTAVVISGTIGIAMAYMEYGVWALVWHTLLNNALRVVLLWLFAGWMPQLAFSVSSFKTLFSFGSKILASSLLHTIYTNLYTLIIGKKFAATELGYFNRASTLAQFPSTNLTNVIVRAVYPIQCKMQDDSEQLNRMFIVYLRMACYAIFPIMIGLCALAEPIVRILLTDKWLPAVPFFQILCIAYMWDPVMKINHNMLNVKGRTDFFLHAEIIKKIVAAIILIATIPLGVTAMCLGLILYAIADMIIITHYTHRITDITFWQQVKELTPIMLLATSMGGILYGCVALLPTPATQLTVGVIVGIVYYFAISRLCRIKELDIILSFVSKEKR